MNPQCEMPGHDIELFNVAWLNIKQQVAFSVCVW